MLVLTAGGSPAIVDMVVDSGADRSLLPLGVAKELGIDRALRRATPGEGISGRSFRTWNFTAPIEAQVLIDGETGEVWEAQFELEPAFSKFPNAVLGRADFFARFAVAFEYTDPPRFHLADSLREVLD